MLEHPDHDVREQALDMLGKHRIEGSFDIVLRFINDENEGVRETAIFNLGEIGDDRAVPFLIDIARYAQSERIRSEALAALESFRDSSILDVLIEEVYRPKRSRRPRQIVAKQLKRYNSESSVDALIDLINEEEEGDVYVRIFAVDSLLELNRPRLQPIWSRLQRDEHQYIAEIATKGLISLSHPI